MNADQYKLLFIDYIFFITTACKMSLEVNKAKLVGNLSSFFTKSGVYQIKLGLHLNG